MTNQTTRQSCNSSVYPNTLAETTAVSQAEPLGFVSNRKVRAVAFGLTVFSILVGVFGGILVVWDLATQDTFWRLMASLGLVVGGVAAFAMVNTMFGSRPSQPAA